MDIIESNRLSHSSRIALLGAALGFGILFCSPSGVSAQEASHDTAAEEVGESPALAGAGPPVESPSEEPAIESAMEEATSEIAAVETQSESGGDEQVDAGEEAEAAEGERTERPYWLRAVGEVGFLAVMDHKIQFGQDGSNFDFRASGGQDNLFFVGRLSVELGLFRHHQIIFLYQPLSLNTSNVLPEELRVDGLDYPEGTPMNFTYDFPFYRLSYLYDFFARRDLEVAIGLTFQIRNANIIFASQDGTMYRSNRDVGFVPALKLRVTYHFPFGFWLGTEIDGMYAPVSYLNGSDDEIVGAILDASVRAGIDLPRGVQVFLNVRYLGGGAIGTDNDNEGPGDGYVRNWIHFLTVTLGVNWDIL